MQPTSVISRRRTTGKGTGFLWLCDNKKEYTSEEIARIAGKTKQAIIQHSLRHGYIGSGLFQNKKRKCSDPVYTCEAGDVVIHKGQKVWVESIFARGREARNHNGGVRAWVVVCRILPDRLHPEGGQILKNSSFLIEDNWRHQ